MPLTSSGHTCTAPSRHTSASLWTMCVRKMGASKEGSFAISAKGKSMKTTTRFRWSWLSEIFQSLKRPQPIWSPCALRSISCWWAFRAPSGKRSQSYSIISKLKKLSQSLHRWLWIIAWKHSRWWESSLTFWMAARRDSPGRICSSSWMPSWKHTTSPTWALWSRARKRARQRRKNIYMISSYRRRSPNYRKYCRKSNRWWRPNQWMTKASWVCFPWPRPPLAKSKSNLARHWWHLAWPCTLQTRSQWPAQVLKGWSFSREPWIVTISVSRNIDEEEIFLPNYQAAVMDWSWGLPPKSHKKCQF